MSQFTVPFGTVPAFNPTPPSDEPRLSEVDFHTRMAGAWFNEVWRLMEKPDRTPEETDRMIHGAHASRLHWQYVGEAVNWKTGEWQISRVYWVLRQAEPALWHARRAVELAHQHQITGFHLASAYEGMARALRLYPHESEQAEIWLGKAKILLGMLRDKDEIDTLNQDIATNVPLVGESNRT